MSGHAAASQAAGPALRAATPADAAALAAIYNPFIAETVVTFEETPVDAAEMARRLAEIERASLPWLAAEMDGRLAGYAYAAPWRVRSAYRFSVETTIYVDRDHARCGIGSRLYGALFAELRPRGLHCAIGGITLPNEGSVALHEKFGFAKTAHFREVGYKFGQWLDVGYWQYLF